MLFAFSCLIVFNRTGRFSRLEECGIISRFSKLSLFLQNENNEGKKKYICLRVNSRELLPEEFRNCKIEDLPPAYQNPIYICPNSMKIDIFESEITLKEPVDMMDLVNTCNNVERIMMNMYPGGSGMEVNFFYYYCILFNCLGITI